MNYTITRKLKQWRKVTTDLDLMKEEEECYIMLKMTNGSFIEYVMLSVLTLLPVNLKKKYSFNN